VDFSTRNVGLKLGGARVENRPYYSQYTLFAGSDCNTRNLNESLLLFACKAAVTFEALAFTFAVVKATV